MAKCILTYVAAKNLVETGSPEDILQLSNVLSLMGFSSAVETAREAVIAKKAIEAKRFVTAFQAHANVGNTGAMGSTLRQLHGAELQAGLIRHFGSVEERDRFLSYAESAISLVAKAKAGAKKHHNRCKIAA